MILMSQLKKWYLIDNDASKIYLSIELLPIHYKSILRKYELIKRELTVINSLII